MARKLTHLVTIKLPSPIASGLRALAKRTGKNQSQLVREGLELRLHNEGAAAMGSALDLAGDAVGSLEGPRDLASHPRHMRGFGE